MCIVINLRERQVIHGEEWDVEERFAQRKDYNPFTLALQFVDHVVELDRHGLLGALHHPRETRSGSRIRTHLFLRFQFYASPKISKRTSRARGGESSLEKSLPIPPLTHLSQGPGARSLEVARPVMRSANRFRKLCVRSNSANSA